MNVFGNIIKAERIGTLGHDFFSERFSCAKDKSLQYQGHTDHLMLSWNVAQGHIQKFKSVFRVDCVQPHSIDPCGYLLVFLKSFGKKQGFSEKRLRPAAFSRGFRSSPRSGFFPIQSVSLLAAISEMNWAKKGLAASLPGLNSGLLGLPMRMFAAIVENFRNFF